MGLSFILNFFVNFSMLVIHRKSELETRRNNFLTKEDEEQHVFSWRGVYCTTFITIVTKMKTKFKLKWKLFSITNLRGKKEKRVSSYVYSNVFVFVVIKCWSHCNRKERANEASWQCVKASYNVLLILFTHLLMNFKPKRFMLRLVEHRRESQWSSSWNFSLLILVLNWSKDWQRMESSGACLAARLVWVIPVFSGPTQKPKCEELWSLGNRA